MALDSWIAYAHALMNHPQSLQSPGKSPLLVSILIPVWNSGQTLPETLQSIAAQTLPKDRMEMIIIDDASTDAQTRALLATLEASPDFQGIALRVVHHTTHLSAAHARNTGFAAAKGAFICCLDSDDILLPAYLKKAALTLEAHPRAGWVYPGIRIFGHGTLEMQAQDFDAKQLYFNNYCHVSSLTCREMWEDLRGQRMEYLANGLPWFEDWDFWIRGMARGWYGVPLKEMLVRYRRSLHSTNTRHGSALLLSNVLLYRLHVWSFWRRIRRADRSRRQDILRKDPIILRILERIVCWFTGRNVVLPPLRAILMLLFTPRRAVQSSRLYTLLPTQVERRFRLHSSLNNLPPSPLFLPAPRKGPTIMFAHHWWHLGGAETVLYDWMRAARTIPGVKIIDIVSEASYPPSLYYKDQFAEIADEQYGLSHMSTNAIGALEICRNLVELERPGLIFNMSSSHFYALSRLLNKHHPPMRQVDLLHCEDNLDPSWFGIASEYQDALDKRIVTSDYWKQVLLTKYQETPERVLVASNAIDMVMFDPARFDRTTLRTTLDIPEEAFVIGFIGRLCYQKNPEVLLEAATLLRGNLEYHVVIVGSGELEERMRVQAAALPNVTMLPATRDAASFFALFDIAVFPSVYEGSPLVGLEAGAMNIPVIATDIVGFREQLTDGHYGFLYPQQSPAKDAQKIVALIKQHRYAWRSIGHRGRPFVLAHHNRTLLDPVYRSIIEAELAAPNMRLDRNYSL